MKRILIPTDFSPQSAYTVKYVIDFLLAKGEPIRIVLINTYLVNHTDPGQVIQVNDQMKQHSKAQLEQQKNQVLAETSSDLVEVETQSHFGSLNNVILKILQTEQVDLLAMSENQCQCLQKIADKLQCPVLIVSKAMIAV